MRYAKIFQISWDSREKGGADFLNEHDVLTALVMSKHGPEEKHSIEVSPVDFADSDPVKTALEHRRLTLEALRIYAELASKSDLDTDRENAFFKLGAFIAGEVVHEH